MKTKNPVELAPGMFYRVVCELDYAAHMLVENTDHAAENTVPGQLALDLVRLVGYDNVSRFIYVEGLVNEEHDYI